MFGLDVVDLIGIACVLAWASCVAFAMLYDLVAGRRSGLKHRGLTSAAHGPPRGQTPGAEEIDHRPAVIALARPRPSQAFPRLARRNRAGSGEPLRRVG